MTKSSKETMINDELQVLTLLKQSAKDSIDDIAKKCDFSRQKVWRIIKKLQNDKIIWGYTAVFDEQRIGKTHFIVMIKKTQKQVDEKTVDSIIFRRTGIFAKDFGVTIESSSYVHGEYDWILTFTADDVKQAKKFTDSLPIFYPNVIEKTTILQTLMFIRKQYILNPGKEKLKDFL